MKSFPILTLISLLLFASCTATNKLVDTSCPAYKKESLDRNLIKTAGIGIMPVLGGAEKEQYRRPMAEAINTSIGKAFGEDVIPTTAVMRALNDASLSDAYTQAINNYQTSGIIPADLVSQIGESLGVRYLLYTRLLADSEYQLLSSNQYGNVTTQVDELYIQAQVWDTQEGDVVWEGKGGIAKLNTERGDMVRLTAEGLAGVIGKPAGHGPCEDKELIFKSVSEAYVGNIFVITLVSLGLTAIIFAM